MAFYDNDKKDRQAIVAGISESLLKSITRKDSAGIEKYFGDGDTYIRKAAYLAVGKIYETGEKLRSNLLSLLTGLSEHEDPLVRQTVINAAGEIGKKHFKETIPFFDAGLQDPHHSPRNAVIGSIKKMGQVNPQPVLAWAAKHLHHSNKEIRREICHGIELRGRTHPQDILPLLQELQYDKTARVRNTLVHVLGQIAYKKGCLPTVISHLSTWKNKELVEEALEEIIDVHERYKDFAAMTQRQAKAYIRDHYQP